MALALTDLNAFTTQEVVPRTTDVIFKQSPLFTRLLTKNRVGFEGGKYIQKPLTFAELNGDFFTKDDAFNTAYVKTETAFTVNMKFAYVNITLYGQDNVLGRGRNAAFSLVETKFANASLKMAKMLAQAMYRDGQTTDGTGVLSSSKYFDGLPAWIDDGNSSGTYGTATDSTKSFAAVGGITRTDMFANPVAFTAATTPAAMLGGANAFVNRGYSSFSVNTVQDAFGNVWYGNDYPDMIVSTQTFWNKLWQTTQPNQRYMADKSVDVANVGFRAMTWNGISEVVVDKYMPSDGVNGVAYGLNTKYLKFYITTQKKYQLGFTGFKDAQGNDNLCGQFLFAGNLMCESPRTNFKLVGSAIV